MDAAKQDALDALKVPLGTVTGFSADELAQGKDLGSMNFQRGKELFNQTIALAAELKALPIDLLPIGTIREFQGPFDQLASLLNQIAGFTLSGQQNPESVRNALIQQLQQHYDQAFVVVTPHLSYLSLKSAQVQETMRRSAELLKDTQDKATTGLADIADKQKQIDDIVQAARDAVAKIGVAQFATRFEQVSREHADSSRTWLIATALLGLGTIGVAISFVWLLPPVGTLADLPALQRVLTKIVVVSILYFSAIWAGRNYRSHRHLSVVNAHRQNALATFETFVSAASDGATKNAVLLEATRCIFSPSVTGYLGAEEDTGNSRVVEVLKNVGTGSGAN
jgi:hypothetical protein